jgi:hypothetical protein
MTGGGRIFYVPFTLVYGAGYDFCTIGWIAVFLTDGGGLKSGRKAVNSHSFCLWVK